MVVKREDSLDLFPLAILWSDACAAIFRGTSDHVVDLAISFSLSQWLSSQGSGSIRDRLDLTDAMEPVLNSRAIDDIGQDLFVGGFQEYEQRGLITSADLGGQAYLVEDSNELLELSNALCFVWVRESQWMPIKSKSSTTHRHTCDS